MTFKGFPPEAIEFYEGLEADNSKSYWTANKAVYEEKVHAPMAALLEDLSATYGEAKIYRPYRDVRFSADKSPYKTAIAASLSRGGYVQLSSAGLAAGSGMYMMEADQLERYRQAVDEEASGELLENLVETARKQGIEVSGHDALKSAPRGYAKDHPRVELLKYKGVIAWKSWPVARWLGTPAAAQRIVDFFEASRPLNDWLATNVGESTMPARSR
jgi:uncharacterized protein (TIGR02453 family)